ncbi:MAG: DUF1801 domain-containing protein [Hyphomicrobiaceae bacterium]|nr:DUF1801 domain-containing protein [Hyphomicrobiaceae bacterium]
MAKVQTKPVPVLPDMPGDVAAVFERAPEAFKGALGRMRGWIFEEAAAREEVGSVAETLRWGEMAYLTHSPRSGTTIRLAAWERPDRGSGFGLFVPCQTTLIEQFRHQHGEAFRFDKNRGILFSCEEELREAPLRHFIALAHTYHLG